MAVRFLSNQNPLKFLVSNELKRQFFLKESDKTEKNLLREKTYEILSISNYRLSPQRALKNADSGCCSIDINQSFNTKF